MPRPVTITTPGLESPEGLPDISDWQVWTGDRVARRDGWRVLRDTPGLPLYPERVLQRSPIAPGPGVPRRDPARRRVGRQPPPGAVLLQPWRPEHGRPDRRANPRDDITSALMATELDGAQPTAQEFGSFFILLAVAGNETTRNAIGHGVTALTDFPEQRDLWFSDYDTHVRTAVAPDLRRRRGARLPPEHR